MSIIRICHPKQYSTIPTEALLDNRLSLAALGLLVRLLARPDSWEVRVEVLRRQESVGRDRLRCFLRELESAGYLIRRCVHGPGGQFTWISEIYDKPQDTGRSVDGSSDDTVPWKPVDGKSGDGQSVDGLTVDGKSGDISTTEIPTNEVTKNTTTTTSDPDTNTNTDDRGGCCDADTDVVAIVLPRILSSQEAEVRAALRVAPACYRQQIVDELAGAHAAGVVKNPVGWLRKVAQTVAANGAFSGDYARRVRAARERERTARRDHRGDHRVRLSDRRDPQRPSTAAAAREGLHHIKQALSGVGVECLDPKSAQETHR